MGSIAIERDAVSHGIIRGGAKTNDGPIDAGTGSIGAHIKARQEEKLDQGRLGKVKAWLEELLGETFTEETFQLSLMSGVRLCTALNKVYPATIAKINQGSVVFSQRENISNYVKGCGRLGFNKSNLFDVPDLYDNQNMTKVVENLCELAHFGTRKTGLPKWDE